MIGADGAGARAPSEVKATPKVSLNASTLTGEGLACPTSKGRGYCTTGG